MSESASGAWVLDLDGVVWRGDDVIPGSVEAIAELQYRGIRVGYATNNSMHSAQGYVDKLASMGVLSTVEDVVHAGHAVATRVDARQRVMLLGGDGALEALLAVGAEVVDVEDPRADAVEIDAVVVALRPGVTYEMMSTAVRAAMRCGRLLAPSADPLYPYGDTFLMGGGAVATAVGYSSGVTPEFTGKPLAPMADAVRQRIGAVAVVVGDQVRSDGGLGAELGCDFVRVATGVPLARQEPCFPMTADVVDLWTAVEKFA